MALPKFSTCNHIRASANLSGETGSECYNQPSLGRRSGCLDTRSSSIGVAEVPELPGCAADGETYKEALANVEIIIQEWIETAKELGRPIPAPRGRLAFA